MLNNKIKKIVRNALREDIGTGDVTTGLAVPAQLRANAVILFKEKAVVAGLEFAQEAFRALDPHCCFEMKHKDGDMVLAGTTVLGVKGKARAILTAERVALNFLSYLSSISTETRRYCDAIKPVKADILDTRKTTPGMRELERYVVRTGGGANHRFDLGEMVLLKDNHRAMNRFGSLAEMVEDIRRRTHKPIEVEVDTINELEDVLRANPDMILLDNMSLAQLRRAVKIVHQLPRSRRPLLEASGGVTLKTVRAIAKTGVDRISVGALTHSRRAVDVSLEMIS
ncbi:MAG: carboxylating nicotinate-nucleotide diphosphorylase [Candidatus Omnitrophica bacterium]|nr:carboxylating nicotinate-nucleotide diphosphorylase [Candidatus Omnitrophota bacterium]